MNDVLSIGLVHLDVQYGRPGENRAALLSLVEQSASSGAGLILAPELAVSGYSFDSLAEVAPFAETLQGETLTELGKSARRHGLYICAGLVERDPGTGIFYNSACVLGPDGRLAAHHRKIAAERRWACPGSPSHWNIFDAPWGRMGVLICSDTYYGLLPRALALQGVDLLLIPASWPASGIDPRKVWRARALENGMGVVACNRTGTDRRMDCRSAPSYATTASGEVLVDAVSASSAVWSVPFPLEEGRLPSRRRKAIMAKRRPEDFAAICLDVNGLDDFSGLWGLPEAGTLEIRCFVQQTKEQAMAALESAGKEAGPAPVLAVLPGSGTPLPMGPLEDLLKERNLAIVAPVDRLDGVNSPYALVSASQKTVLTPGANSSTGDFGPARIALTSTGALHHPELAVALSKQGCDLLVPETDSLDEDTRLLLGVKSLERAAIAAAAPDGAAIFEPPEGHAPWKETTIRGPGLCKARLEIGPLRSKRFQDRVDMEVLLRR